MANLPSSRQEGKRVWLCGHCRSALSSVTAAPDSGQWTDLGVGPGRSSSFGSSGWGLSHGHGQSTDQALGDYRCFKRS